MRKTILITTALLMMPFAASAVPTLEQISPLSVNYTIDVDFTAVEGSGLGTVQGIAQAVDWDLGLGNASTSGCDAADFLGFTPGRIALIQRGACTFRLKVENAILAGAIGAIIFNQGNTEDRKGAILATLGLPALAIPTLFTTYDLGVSLDGATVRMSVPEPGTLALLSFGLLGLGVARRRRKA